MLSSIGHAGENLLSVGYELHATATKMLNGELRDEKTLALIFSAEGFDSKSDDAILAANPNAGVSSYLATMQEARDRAIAIPSLQPAFKSHILCLWEDASANVQWISPPILAPCRAKDLRMEDFKHWCVGEHEGVTAPDMLRPFVIGLERSSRQEPAVVIYATKGFLDGIEHYYLFPKYFSPADGANDDDALADDILSLHRRSLGYGVLSHPDGYKLKALAHDSWQQPSAKLEKGGVQTAPFAKTARTFSPVMDWFMSLALAGRVHFPDDDENLYSNLLGIHAHVDLNNNRFPRRANADKTIDAAISAFYAMRLAMAPGLLDPPAVSDVKAVFINEDGSVSESSPNGLVQTMPPLTGKERYGN